MFCIQLSIAVLGTNWDSRPNPDLCFLHTLRDQKKDHILCIYFCCDSGWEEGTSKHNISFAFARGTCKVAGILMVDLVSSFLEPMKLSHAFPTPFAPEFFNFYLENRSKIIWFKNQVFRFSQAIPKHPTLSLQSIYSRVPQDPRHSILQKNKRKKTWRKERKVQHHLNKNTFLFIRGGFTL